jgi:hypothetical protein
MKALVRFVTAFVFLIVGLMRVDKNIIVPHRALGSRRRSHPTDPHPPAPRLLPGTGVAQGESAIKSPSPLDVLQGT